MNIIESIFLGIIQGLTEFLPVSSSGHIELGKYLLNVNVKDPLLFSIVVHAATALSTMVIYRKDIAVLLFDLFKFQWNESTRFVAMILLSMIPVGLAGVFLEEQITTLFEGQIILVGAMLLVTAVLLFFSSRANDRDEFMSFPKSIIIGIAQAIAILPGISRSGATISTALLLGVDRDTAARFSFLMVLPPILGATLLKVKKYLDFSAGDEVSMVVDAGLDPTMEIGTMALLAGFIAAFVSGLFACKLMIRIVRRSKLDYFAIYCACVGVFAIIAGLV